MPGAGRRRRVRPPCGSPDGSTGTISYVTGGNARFPKETLDAAGGGRSARLDNFQRATVWAGAASAPRRAPRRPGQGPAARARGLRRGRAGPARRCRSRSTRWSPPRGPRSRSARAWPAAVRSGCELTGGRQLAWYAAPGRPDVARRGGLACPRPGCPAGLGAPPGQARAGRPPALPPRRAPVHRRAAAGHRGAGARSRPGTAVLASRRRSCWTASGRCSASPGPTWPRRTGSATR